MKLVTKKGGCGIGILRTSDKNWMWGGGILQPKTAKKSRIRGFNQLTHLVKGERSKKNTKWGKSLSAAYVYEGDLQGSEASGRGGGGKIGRKERAPKSKICMSRGLKQKRCAALLYVVINRAGAIMTPKVNSSKEEKGKRSRQSGGDTCRGRKTRHEQKFTDYHVDVKSQGILAGRGLAEPPRG